MHTQQDVRQHFTSSLLRRYPAFGSDVCNRWYSVGGAECTKPVTIEGVVCLHIIDIIQGRVLSRVLYTLIIADKHLPMFFLTKIRLMANIKGY